jgi:hypothetical protein
VEPKAGLDVVVKRKIPSPYRHSNPQSYSPLPSAIPLSYPGSSAAWKQFINLFITTTATCLAFAVKTFCLHFHLHPANKSPQFYLQNSANLCKIYHRRNIILQK